MDTVRPLAAAVKAAGGQRQFSRLYGLARTTVQSFLRQEATRGQLPARAAERVAIATTTPRAAVAAFDPNRTRLAAFVDSQGGVSAAARALGVPRQTLQGALYLNKTAAGRAIKQLDRRVTLVEMYARGVPIAPDAETGEYESVSEEELAVSAGDQLDPDGEDAQYRIAALPMRPPYPTLEQTATRLADYMTEAQQTSAQAAERPQLPERGRRDKRGSPKVRGGRAFTLYAFRIYLAEENGRQPQPIVTPWMPPDTNTAMLQRALFEEEDVEYAYDLTKQVQRRTRRRSRK